MTPPSLAHYDTGPPNIKSLLAPIGAHTPFIPEISIKIFKNTYQPKLEGNPSKIDSLSPETKKNSHFKKCFPKQIAISKRRDRFFLRKTLLIPSLCFNLPAHQRYLVPPLKPPGPNPPTHRSVSCALKGTLPSKGGTTSTKLYSSETCFVGCWGVEAKTLR